MAKRQHHAAEPKALRAKVLPVLVIGPDRMHGPQEGSDGISPTYAISGGDLPARRPSDRAVNRPRPRKPCRSGTLRGDRGVCAIVAIRRYPINGPAEAARTEQSLRKRHQGVQHSVERMPARRSRIAALPNPVTDVLLQAAEPFGGVDGNLHCKASSGADHRRRTQWEPGVCQGPQKPPFAPDTDRYGFIKH